MRHVHAGKRRMLPATLTATVCVAAAVLARAQHGHKPRPTLENVSYGQHERNVLDFWKADSAAPTPLVIYIHGGGFQGGSKQSINGRHVEELLANGISVAALHYRFVNHAPLPAAHHDCRRALQFLRSKSKEWSIDPGRVGAYGGSAGAQLCMYLAFHDDMGQPDADDPVARQSTRLSAVATIGGQTTMDVEWWQKHIPGYDRPHRDFHAGFGVNSRDAYLERIRDVSALFLISPDDPPIYMTYGMAPGSPVPTGAKAQGWKVHHVRFGIALKEKMDALGLEADLGYPGSINTYRSVPEFFESKLLAPQER